MRCCPMLMAVVLMFVSQSVSAQDVPVWPIVWLEDEGPYTVVEYAFGTSSATPTPPVELFNGELLPPGVVLDLHVHDDR